MDFGPFFVPNRTRRRDGYTNGICNCISSGTVLTISCPKAGSAGGFHDARRKVNRSGVTIFSHIFVKALIIVRCLENPFAECRLDRRFSVASTTFDLCIWHMFIIKGVNLQPY
jgi:hypothetical protein